MSKQDQLAVQPQPEPSIGMMLQKVIEGGVTKDSVEVLGKMLEFQERMQTKDAERQFAAAFVALQAAMPKIEATKAVPNNDKTIRYKFAPYEDIMEKVKPVLFANGFAINLDQKTEEGGRITIACTLTHAGGHSRTNSFSVRIGKGPPGSNESQQDGSAATYAKRFALCNALNIVIEKEAILDDANAHGSPMPEVQWKELKKRCEKLAEKENQDVCASLLQFAKAADFAHIGAERFDEIDGILYKKEVKAGLRNEQGDWQF